MGAELGRFPSARAAHLGFVALRPAPHRSGNRRFPARWPSRTRAITSRSAGCPTDECRSSIRMPWDLRVQAGALVIREQRPQDRAQVVSGRSGIHDLTWIESSGASARDVFPAGRFHRGDFKSRQIRSLGVQPETREHHRAAAHPTSLPTSAAPSGGSEQSAAAWRRT